MAISDQKDIGERYPWKAAATSIANTIAFFAAVITVVLAAWNSITPAAETPEEPIERTILYVLLCGALAYFIYRANSNERSARYRQALVGLHKFQHRMRDFHEIVFANEDCLAGTCNFDRLDKVTAELQHCLADALGEVKSVFEIVTGKPVRVCIKYIAASEKGARKLVARTVARDAHSADQMRDIDRILRDKDLDEIDRNRHFEVLTNATNGRWHLRFSSRLEMETEMKMMDARRAYDDLGMKVRIESMLMASISQRSYAAKKAESRASAALIHAAPIPKKTEESEMSAAVDEAIDHNPMTIGIIYVDCENKKAFRRSDTELLFGIADSLFWPLKWYTKISYNTKIKEPKDT